MALAAGATTASPLCRCAPSKVAFEGERPTAFVGEVRLLAMPSMPGGGGEPMSRGFPRGDRGTPSERSLTSFLGGIGHAAVTVRGCPV
mmetsp:Transcript_106904/g.230199  ORF Transcript_106904/g.230199 Transcript_106904/m.230199 type:complete len:88 (+) Transcript_106904:117-380(+)